MPRNIQKSIFKPILRSKLAQKLAPRNQQVFMVDALGLLLAALCAPDLVSPFHVL